MIIFSPSLDLTNRAMPTLLSFPLNLGSHLDTLTYVKIPLCMRAHTCYLSKNIVENNDSLIPPTKSYPLFVILNKYLPFTILNGGLQFGNCAHDSSSGAFIFLRIFFQFFISFVFTFVCAKNKQNV